MGSFSFGLGSGGYNPMQGFTNVTSGSSGGLTYGLEPPTTTRDVSADGTTYKTGSSVADILSALGNIAIGSIMAVRMPEQRIGSGSTVISTPNTQTRIGDSSQPSSFHLDTQQWVLLGVAALLVVVLILRRRG